MQKTCEMCGKRLFWDPKVNWGKMKKYAWRESYCSEECYIQSERPKICKRCNQPFNPTKDYYEFCSTLCKKSFKLYVCKQCGKKLNKLPDKGLCGDCYWLSFVTKCKNCNKPLKKNRRYLISNKNYEFLQGKGYFHSKKNLHRFIKSESKYCDINCIVEKESPYYYDGISKEPYSLEFNEIIKEKVRKRDGYSCQICGKSQYENGKKLAVHHIDYNKNNNELDNLVSTCGECHPKTNFNRQEWVSFFEGGEAAATIP